MAARKNTPRLSVEWRSRIKSGELLERLERHALGQVEMTATEIRAAEVVLKKALPDLKALEITDERTKRLEEMTDDELIIRARELAARARSSERADNAEGGPAEPSGVH